MLCARLEEIGYARSVDYEGDLPFICTMTYEDLPPVYSESNYGAPILSNRINCCDDEERFLTLAKQDLSE